MKVKENECKEKRKYDWCASKEKNTVAAWGVAGELGHGSVHHHTRPQHSIRRKAWPRPFVLASTSAAWWVATTTPRLMGVVLRVPLRPHPIDAPRAQTVFLEEDDHRHEERVASSRMRFRKLSGGREDEGYKGNTRTFWKVFYEEENFNFSLFRRKLKFHIFSCLKLCFKIPKK